MKKTLAALALAALASCSSQASVKNSSMAALDPGFDIGRTYGNATDQNGTGYTDGTWSNPRFNTPQYEANIKGSEKPGAVPPVGYPHSRWVDPDTGCHYSRTGRPTEVSWTLVLNPQGAPLAKPGCQKYFVSEPYSGPDKWAVGPDGTYVRR